MSPAATSTRSITRSHNANFIETTPADEPPTNVSGGTSLYVYNDAVFTDRDFQNLAKIGHASKLDKLTATGRFGLGFNAVYHFTDLPRFVSGEHLVMFDPHTKYVPGATSVQPCIKIRFAETDLLAQFPDQARGNPRHARVVGLGCWRWCVILWAVVL